MSTIGALGIDQSTPKTQEPPMPKPKTVVTAERDAKRAWLSFPGMNAETVLAHVHGLTFP